MKEVCAVRAFVLNAINYYFFQKLKCQKNASVENGKTIKYDERGVDRMNYYVIIAVKV